VVQQWPNLAWTPPASIVYGTRLSATQLNARSDVTGSFSYSPASGTLLPAGTQMLRADFTSLSLFYKADSISVPITVAKLAPTITLSNTGLDVVYDGNPHAVTATIAGVSGGETIPDGALTITYNGSTAVPLNAGTYTVVALYPGSASNYLPSSATTTLTIRKYTPQLVASGGGTYPYDGQPHPATGTATGLNGEVLTPVTVTYPNGDPNPPVNAGSYTVQVRYDATTNYEAISTSVVITITAVTPAIAWAAPADIVYGTPLSATQLNATASVPGQFTYSPALGSLVAAGTAQPLQVTFVPDDLRNYVTTSKTVTINVAKATTTITWPAPAPLTYGVGLSATQLNATTTVPGTFTYTPALGATLNAGTQTLSVAFTPDDTANYTSANATVSITIVKAHTTIAWSPASLAYGTPLGAAQLNATASVPGTFAYSPAAGTMLNAGAGQTLSVTFTPQDLVNYEIETRTSTITVSPVPLQVAVTSIAKPFGAPLPAFNAMATGFVNGDTTASLSGTLAFGTSATAGSAVGQYPITASGLSSANYVIAYVNGVLSIVPASTTVNVTTSANPSGSNQAVTFTATVAVVAPGAGSPTGSIEFRDGSTRLGTVALATGATTVSITTNGLSVGSHTINAIYSGDASFATSTGSLTQTVNAASTSSTVAITSSANPRKVGLSVTLTATVTAPAGGVTGTVEFFDGSTSIGTATVTSNKATLTTSTLATGGHAITARYAGNATVPPSVSPVFVETITATTSTPRTPTVSISASPSPATLDGSVSFTATVTGSLFTRPTGRVVFFANGRVIGDPAGVALASTGSVTAQAVFATSELSHGTHTISAVYMSDSTYRGVAATITLVVN
jgi:hypothetical protein